MKPDILPLLSYAKSIASNTPLALDLLSSNTNSNTRSKKTENQSLMPMVSLGTKKGKPSLRFAVYPLEVMSLGQEKTGKAPKMAYVSRKTGH